MEITFFVDRNGVEAASTGVADKHSRGIVSKVMRKGKF
jgi:hypothetical protein